MRDYTEVAVVGAGPGGLSAALAAARAGARVTLIDMYQSMGGQYLREAASRSAGRPSSRQVRGRRLRDRVIAAGVRVLTETTVWGTFGGKVLALQGEDAPACLQAESIIIATGAYEKAVAFPGWTLPGVMTTGAAQVLLGQGVVPGKRVLFAGTGPMQLLTAMEVVQAGGKAVSVLEGRRDVGPLSEALKGAWGQWARMAEGVRSYCSLLARGVRIRLGWGILAASGEGEVAQATVARLDSCWRPIPGTEETVLCDTICLGYGLVPSTALLAIMGARLVLRPEVGDEIPQRDDLMQTDVPGIYAVGDCAGIGGGQLALLEGDIAGIAAAAHAGHRLPEMENALSALKAPLIRERRFQRLYTSLFTPGPGAYELATDDTVLCRCEETAQSELRRAIDLGADTANEVRAIARCGMGNCEGRMCAQIIARFVARETGHSLTHVGLFRPRPPIYPLSIGQLCRRPLKEYVGQSTQVGA